jgi:hypothetical protein
MSETVKVLTLAEKLQEAKALKAKLEAELKAIQAETALLSAKHNEVMAETLNKLTSTIKQATSSLDIPLDSYPITVTLAYDAATGSRSCVAHLRSTKRETTSGETGSHTVMYGGTSYPSAQALVNHLLAIGTIKSVPTSKYSAIRVLESHKVAFTR